MSNIFNIGDKVYISDFNKKWKSYEKTVGRYGIIRSEISTSDNYAVEIDNLKNKKHSIMPGCFWIHKDFLTLVRRGKERINMNNSSEIFELLGIKPSEEFKILSPFLEKDEKSYKYRLGTDMVVEYKDNFCRWKPNWTILPKLLTGEITIKKIIEPTDEETVAINYAKFIGCQWLAREKDGTIFGYSEKPEKTKDGWIIQIDRYFKKEVCINKQNCKFFKIYYDISFISYDDEEPYYIGD